MPRLFAKQKDGLVKINYLGPAVKPRDDAEIKLWWIWSCGGMVDAEDLKSFDHCDRVGSSPTKTTKF